jgi:hypothetical protein
MVYLSKISLIFVSGSETQRWIDLNQGQELKKGRARFSMPFYYSKVAATVHVSGEISCKHCAVFLEIAWNWMGYHPQAKSLLKW